VLDREILALDEDEKRLSVGNRRINKKLTLENPVFHCRAAASPWIATSTLPWFFLVEQGGHHAPTGASACGGAPPNTSLTSPRALKGEGRQGGVMIWYDPASRWG